MQSWASAELQEYPSEAGAVGPAFQTASLPIPSNLPLTTSTTPAVLRFALGGLVRGDSSLTNAVLEISIESYESGGNEYRIFNPRIVGSLSAVNLNGIHVYIRPSVGTGIGTEDTLQGNYWAGLELTASAVVLPSTLPNGPITAATPMTNIALGAAVQSNSDTLTIGFNSIQ